MKLSNANLMLQKALKKNKYYCFAKNHIVKTIKEQTRKGYAGVTVGPFKFTDIFTMRDLKKYFEDLNYYIEFHKAKKFGEDEYFIFINWDIANKDEIMKNSKEDVFI